MATVWDKTGHCIVKWRIVPQKEVRSLKAEDKQKGISTNACQLFAHLSFFAPHNISFCDIDLSKCMMAQIIIMERNAVFNGGVDVEEVVELLPHTHHNLHLNK